MLPRSRPWAVASAAVAAIAIAAGLSALARSSLFDARTIDVVGAHHLDVDRLLDIAGLTSSANTLRLDERSIERRLERDPWIASATVSTSPPWTIHVDIVERMPIAVAVQASGDRAIAADGTILPDVSTDGLPRIHVQGLPVPASASPQIERTAATPLPDADPATGARALGAIPDEIRGLVRRVSVRLDGTVRLLLSDGTVVDLGAGSVRPSRKGASLARVLAWAGEEGLSLRRISVVSWWAPAVTFAD
jgi:hypothetical protein